MGRESYVVQCIVTEEETPKNCLFHLGFRHPAEGGPSHGGHRPHAQRFGKDRACCSGDILATDRYTDIDRTHTHICAHHNTHHSTSAVADKPARGAASWQTAKLKNCHVTITMPPL